MSYQRPVYHHHHQQQQLQPQQYEHYQQRLQHVPDVFPPPQAPPQPSPTHRQQQSFLQDHQREDVLDSLAFNQGYTHPQQAMSVGSMLPPTTTATATTIDSATMMMMDNYNDDDAQIIKQEVHQHHHGGDPPVDASHHQTFPNDATSYYCGSTRSLYRPRSQKMLAASDFYQVHNQDIAAERRQQQQQHHYDARNRPFETNFTADSTAVGVMPPHYVQQQQQQQHRYHHNHHQLNQQQQLQQPYDVTSPDIDHHHYHHHPLQQQQQQQSPQPQQQQLRYSERESQNYKTPAEMGHAVHRRQQLQQQPHHHHNHHLQCDQAIYMDHPVASSEYSSGKFPSPPVNSNKHKDYAAQYWPPGLSSLSHRAARPANDRYHHQVAARYSHPESHSSSMSDPREGGQFSVGGIEDGAQQLICPQQRQQQQRQQPDDIHEPGQLYAVHSGHLVRQDLSVNPRKISRVSISEMASSSSQPSSRQQQHQLGYQSTTRHSVENLGRYSSNSTPDTCRLVPSSSSPPEDDNNNNNNNSNSNSIDGQQQQVAASQQPSYTRKSAPFVESVSSDQTGDYSSSSFDDSPSAPLTLSNQSPPSPGSNHFQNQKQQLQQQQQQQQQGNYIDMRSSGTVSQDWLDMICRHMIEHMNNFGICVIDNFLGSLKGEAILSEVLQLYSHRNYTTGRLVSDVRDGGGDGDDDDEDGDIGSSESRTNATGDSVRNSTTTSNNDNQRLQQQQQQQQQQQEKLSPSVVDAARTIRNDRVIWVDGCENGCSEINNLIQTLCSVITNSSRLSLYSGNALDKIVIDKRTKAHVACYPGNRTRYIKHVDNPNNDGRVITAIYYLNKNWNTKRDGGLLRMFPAGMDTVANIEPLFDRVLFFWSDRRNPHEVLPAFRDRFAITVWYIGSQETTTSRVAQ